MSSPSPSSCSWCSSPSRSMRRPTAGAANRLGDLRPQPRPRLPEPHRPHRPHLHHPGPVSAGHDRNAGLRHGQARPGQSLQSPNPRRDNLWISLAGPASNGLAASAPSSSSRSSSSIRASTFFSRSSHPAIFQRVRTAAPAQGVFPPRTPGPGLFRGPDQHHHGRVQPHPRPAARRQRDPDGDPARPARRPLRASPAIILHRHGLGPDGSADDADRNLHRRDPRMSPGRPENRPAACGRPDRSPSPRQPGRGAPQLAPSPGRLLLLLCDRRLAPRARNT